MLKPILSALVLSCLLQACGGEANADPKPTPCGPDDTQSFELSAPPDMEFPECSELPAHPPSEGRTWCCNDSDKPALFDRTGL
jgi:hypothetical protein